MINEASARQLLATLVACGPDDPRRPALRERAITAWLPLAHRLARRYGGRGENTEDLMQVAATGLVECVDRYRADYGAEFAAYAAATVLGQIKRHFRDQCWSVRVPRRQKETWLLILSLQDTLTQELRREPRAPDIAARLDISVEDVVDAMGAAKVYQSISLALPVGPDRDTQLGDSLGACDAGYELTELRMALRDAVAELDDRERLLLRLRFEDNLTQRQIGERLGVSQMHVSRLLSITFGRLRHAILEAD